MFWFLIWLVGLVLLIDAWQTALGEPIPVDAVAMTILSVASRRFSSHVHGQVVNVDGGKQGRVMWSEEEGRALREG
jgi:hypothetical protein